MTTTDIDTETAKRILDLPMRGNDADAGTVREYLVALLRQLWIDGHGFSGKKPFGNSGWEDDLIVPLIRAGLLEGTLDEYGCPDGHDYREGDRLILSAIDHL